ncbi:hypothetical protein EV426DRAFT_645023 [Tirmania nivea]|nr:hypothetical protein EV426DRAFT_645023 [Tirmania nivea]
MHAISSPASRRDSLVTINLPVSLSGGIVVFVIKIYAMFESKSLGLWMVQILQFVEIEEEGNGQNAERTNSIIRVRACVEQLQQQLYAIHESMDQLNLEDTWHTPSLGLWMVQILQFVEIEEEGNGQNAERTNSIIRVRACVEQLQQQLYAIHESMDQLNLEDTVRNQRVEEWVNHVQVTLDSLTSLRAVDIASRNRPWEL